MGEGASVSIRQLAMVSAVWLLAAGCSHGPRTMGELGLPAMAHLAENIFLVDAEVDGHPGGRLLTDTGSPFTLVDAKAFPGASLGTDLQTHCDLGFGALVIDDVDVLQASVGLDDVLAGIVGGDVMRDFSMGFDYRDMAVRFGNGADLDGVAEPGTSVPFALEGGGRASLSTTVVDYPATRIVIDVAVEGSLHPFILDTGASVTNVRSTVFAALTADGRKILEGLPVATAAGASTARVTRTHAITIGGESVSGSVAMTTDDALLDAIAEEVGHPVDGLLGGTFLREFFLTVDYPNRKLVLRRWNDRSHIVDEFVSVGLGLGQKSNGSYRVSTVYAGTAADMAGVSVGDEVDAVDGVSLVGVEAIDAAALLVGSAGSTHTLSLGVTDVPLLANQTITLPVEDLVPSP